MELEEVRKAKEKLEEDIKKAIVEFTESTDIEVTGVFLNSMRIFHDGKRTSLRYSVEVEAKL